MMAAPEIRSGFPSLVLTAMLVALALNPSRAEGPITQPRELLAHETADR
jgi:hypothetical protein